MSKPEKENFYLDTSFLIKLLNFDEHKADKELAKFANGQRYACYYTLIEFNTGLISAAIQFHKYVLEQKDVATAMVRTTNMFSRGPKLSTLVHAALIRANTVIDNSDYLTFADLLEMAIVRMHYRTTRIIKDFIGEYPKHQYSIKTISGVQDFSKFPSYNAKNVRPTLSEIWNKNAKDIEAAKKYMDELKTNKLKLNQLEKEFAELLCKLIADPNAAISNKHKGDFAISLEAPKTQIVRAYDKLFDITIPALEKAGGYAKLPQY